MQMKLRELLGHLNKDNQQPSLYIKEGPTTIEKISIKEIL
jgi:hypothetical protein